MRSITPASGTAAVQVALADNLAGSGTRSGLEIALGNNFVGTPTTLYVQIYNAGASLAPNAIWIDGRKDSTASQASTTALVNGVWYGIGVTVTNLQPGQSALTFGTFSDGFDGLTGGIQAAFFFQGVLPDSLMDELTADPSALLLWPSDDLPAAGTPSLPPITGTAGITFANMTAAATGALAIKGAAGITFDDMTVAATGLNAATSTVHGVIRRRHRGRTWDDVPQELEPVVALAENYADALAVQRAVDDMLARYARMTMRTNIARRERLVETLKQAVLAAVERAAEDDDEEALTALL